MSHRKRGDEAKHPEARFVGPGRVALLEPNLKKDGNRDIVWVIMGSRLWRCAVEQLRPATEGEKAMGELDDRNN